MQQGAWRVARTAKELAPYDTHALERAITVRPLLNDFNKGALVVSPVEYSIYQEFGTVKMKAHPFLRPALIAERAKVQKDIADFVKKKLKKIAGT